MSSERANAIFDVLKREAGADEDMRAQFVSYLLQMVEHGPWLAFGEFRFQGTLGFGGKYRTHRNTVDCYREDETPKRLATIARTNAALAKVEP